MAYLSAKNLAPFASDFRICVGGIPGGEIGRVRV